MARRHISVTVTWRKRHYSFDASQLQGMAEDYDYMDLVSVLKRHHTIEVKMMNGTTRIIPLINADFIDVKEYEVA